MGNRRKIGKWLLLRRQGKGSNAYVHVVTRDKVHEYAMKELKSCDRQSEPYQRFEREVEILRKLSGEPGIITVVDFCLPGNPTKKTPAFYVMPLLRPIGEAATQWGAEQTVAAIQQLAATLSRLQQVHQLSHRDIKPENIFVAEAGPVLGDFGLVKHPSFAALTEERKKLGPIWYIAPEMMSPSSEVDYAAADVYSLAKTLWVLLTGQRYPVQGSYCVYPEDIARFYSLASYVFFDQKRLRMLDVLIERATHINPGQRPSMAEFARELEVWLNPRVPVAGGGRDVSDIARAIAAETRRDAVEADLSQFRGHQSHLLDEAARERLRPISDRLRDALGSGIRVEAGQCELELAYATDISKPGQEWRICDAIRLGNREGTASLSCFVRMRLFSDGTLYMEAGHCLSSSGEVHVLWRDCGITTYGLPTQEALLGDLVRGLEDHLSEPLGKFLELIRGREG